MTKKYFQLTLEQRYKIESLKTAGLGQTEIAKIIGVNKSTVCREFKRNIPLRGFGGCTFVRSLNFMLQKRRKKKPICGIHL